jgi:hypothetical protein
MTFPAVGVTHLVIETMGRDGQIRGAEGVDTIQVRYWPTRHGGAPHLSADGATAQLEGDDIGRVIVPSDLAVTVRQAAGDLRVEALDAAASLEAVSGDLLLERLTAATRVGQVGGSLRAEEVADLRVLGRCQGDLRCENSGDVQAELVGGDARVVSGGAVRLGRVRGDVWIEKMRGELRIGRADGDGRLNEVGGAAVIQTLSGDLRAAGLAGGLAVGQVAGDVALHGPYTTAESYALNTDGDVLLHLPADADLRLFVQAGGRVRSDPRLTAATNQPTTFTAVLGSGAGRINVTCAGDVRIKQAGVEARGEEPRPWRGTEGLGDLGERIRQQVTASLASAGINLETGEVRWSRSGVKPPKPSRPPTPERPRGPAGPGLSEEHLTVLKMVEAGKITAEEAETLLRALGA